MSKHSLTDGFYHVPIVDLGTRLRDNFGLRIREHSAFGDGSVGKHAPNSYHYYDEAIDVTDHRPDVIDGVSWQKRTGNLQNLLSGSGAEIIGPNSGDPGHSTHLHLAAKDGMFKLTPKQYGYLFGGQAGGKNSTFTLDPDTDYTGMFPKPTHNADGTPKDPDSDAQEGLTKYVDKLKTAKQAVEDNGNDFGSMKSKRLGAALAGAQESIIQQRMDNGEQFGYTKVEVPKDPTPSQEADPATETDVAPTPTPTPTKTRIAETITSKEDDDKE